MLILFAIFVDHSKFQNQDLESVQAQSAFASFAFFLVVVYTSFGSMLAVFRNDIIKDGKYVAFTVHNPWNYFLVVLGEDPDAQEAQGNTEQPPEYN